MPPPPQPWVIDNNCVKYYPDPTWQWGVMARTQILGMWALWPWPRRYDLGSRSWHTLWSCTTIVWNIKIQPGIEELWPGHWFWVCVTLTLEIWPWVKVMTHPWVIDNNCVKYSDRTSGYEVMAWTRCEQTDRQTVIPIYPQTLFAGGITSYLRIMWYLWWQCDRQLKDRTVLSLNLENIEWKDIAFR